VEGDRLRTRGATGRATPILGAAAQGAVRRSRRDDLAFSSAEGRSAGYRRRTVDEMTSSGRGVRRETNGSVDEAHKTRRETFVTGTTAFAKISHRRVAAGQTLTQRPTREAPSTSRDSQSQQVRDATGGQCAGAAGAAGGERSRPGGER